MSFGVYYHSKELSEKGGYMDKPEKVTRVGWRDVSVLENGGSILLVTNNRVVGIGFSIQPIRFPRGLDDSEILEWYREQRHDSD